MRPKIAGKYRIKFKALPLINPDLLVVAGAIIGGIVFFPK
jgi:hypothetical protein